MNHLVFLDAQAGELEKILSGTKTMLIKKYESTQMSAHPVCPGDILYFLRNNDEYVLRVKATVVLVRSLTSHLGDDLSRTLKEMQPRLHLTEEQFNFWSTKGPLLLIELGSAQKTSVIPLAPDKITNRSDWIPFESFNLVTP